MLADLEFEAEWILSVHRWGWFPRRAHPVRGNIAVWEDTHFSASPNCVPAWGCLTASQATSYIG